MPLLSIITINYNDKEGLAKTLESVFVQTFPDVEYIVVDGGSTDGSKELLEKNSGRISKWVSEADKGIYHAMNKGIGMAGGKYLQFLNSGDVLSHAKVLDDFFSKPLTHDIVTGDIVLLSKAGNKPATNPHHVDAVHLYESTILHPCTFIRKELFSNYGLYDESYRIVADYEFFVRVLAKYQVSYEHRSVAVAHFDTNGISNQHPEKLQAERKRVLETYFSPLQLAAIKELYEIRTDPQYNLLKWMNRFFFFRGPLRLLAGWYVKWRS